MFLQPLHTHTTYMLLLFFWQAAIRSEAWQGLLILNFFTIGTVSWQIRQTQLFRTSVKKYCNFHLSWKRRPSLSTSTCPGSEGLTVNFHLPWKWRPSLSTSTCPGSGDPRRQLPLVLEAAALAVNFHLSWKRRPSLSTFTCPGSGGPRSQLSLF